MDERRAYPRSAVPPLKVRAGGTVFDTVEWSQGNMTLDAGGRYAVGSLISVDAVGLSAKKLKAVEIRGRVTRVTDRGWAAIDFLHRDDDAMTVLDELAGG